jgi:aquaporin Z
MQKYLTELVGTALLVVTIGCVFIAPAAGNVSPVAVGLVVSVLTLLAWSVSGAHFNPAVTCALRCVGRLGPKDFVPYLVFQFLGAGVGVVLVKVLKRGYTAALLSPVSMPALVAEFLFCFLLVYTFLFFTDKAAKGTSSVPVPWLGAIYLGTILTVGNISGGLINPATNIAAMMLGMLPWKSLWIYVLADFGAAWVAAAVFNRLLVAGKN